MKVMAMSSKLVEPVEEVDVPESPVSAGEGGIKASFADRCKRTSKAAWGAIRGLFAGSYGRLTLPLLCLTIFLSISAGYVQGMSWWAPWAWFFIGATLALTMSRFAVLLKIVLSVIATAFAMSYMSSTALLASPYTEDYIVAGLAPLIALVVYLLISTAGVYGVSRWTPIPALMFFSFIASVVTLSGTLSPLFGALVFFLVFTLPALGWYRFGVRFMYKPTLMPQFLTPERLDDKVNEDARNNKAWRYTRFVGRRKGTSSPVIVIGERSYMYFPVQFSTSPVLEVKYRRFGKTQTPKSQTLTYRDKRLEPWLYDQVISKTPAGVIPILLDVTDTTVKKKSQFKRIEVAQPDSPRRADGTPVNFFHVGIIPAQELLDATLKLPLVARAEAIYKNIPELTGRANARLERRYFVANREQETHDEE